MDDKPKIRARNVLIDIDGTVVGSRGKSGGDTFLRVLEELLARKHGICNCLSRKLIQTAYDPAHDCISAALKKIGVNEQEYLSALLPALNRHISVYPDAAVAIKSLFDRGFKLFPATTNSGFAIQAKLGCNGDGSLADCFSRLCGGAEVHPDGKSGPDFYTSLTDMLGIDPDLTVMVGDNPKSDLLYPRQAGISATVIVRRSQAAEWTREDGGIYIHALNILGDILEPL